MSAPKIWSNEKKKYIQSLILSKRILFANVDGGPRAYWEKSSNGYNIIIGYCRTDDYYIACNAKNHSSFKSISLDCISEYINDRKIRVCYRKKDNERIIFIPCNKIEDFCKYSDFYLNMYENT